MGVGVWGGGVEMREELIRAQSSGAAVTVDSSLNTEVCGCGVWEGGTGRAGSILLYNRNHFVIFCYCSN